MEYPFIKTWWIKPDVFMGGQYPGDPDPGTHTEKLRSLLGLGIDFFVNLQRPGDRNHDGWEFIDYMPIVRQVSPSGANIECRRFPINDEGIPDGGMMVTILDCIDDALKQGRKIYLHCWGGNGRTGTVAGCWLVRHGRTPQQAFEEMRSGRQGRQFTYPAPENEQQQAFVRHWAQLDPRLNDS